MLLYDALRAKHQGCSAIRTLFFFVLPIKDEYRISSKNPLHSQILRRHFGCRIECDSGEQYPDYANIPEYIIKVPFMSRLSDYCRNLCLFGT